MKIIQKLLLISLIAIFLPNTTLAAKEPVFQAGSIDAETVSIMSSDTNEIKEVKNIANIINNKADLSNMPKVENWIIDGINNFRESNKDQRICIFCWIFAALFGIWLVNYFKNIRHLNSHDTWFRTPVLVGLLVYFLHAIFHLYFASYIFLEYYWMIIFDELAIAYIVYSTYFFVRDWNSKNHQIRLS